MGGKDHYQVDREAGSAALELYDMVTMAKQSRQFLTGEIPGGVASIRR